MNLRSLLIIVLSAFSLLLSADPTHVTVRVLAKDAKFIGTSMEGAAITIENAANQELLAKGLTQGATGDTKTIMKTPKQRGDQLSSEDSAAFNTTLELTEPTKVKISATGPMNLGDNAVTVSAEYWLIPGKHMNHKDAILLEMPGFYMVSELKPGSAENQVTVSSELRMMCGCPIEPDGLWDANQYEIEAYLLKDGKEIARKAMKFVETSQFSATFDLSGAGSYQVITHAYDRETSNTGYDAISFNK